jgi:endonuclease/exonuclease/phosphatase family metal-dependent hydrolase
MHQRHITGVIIILAVIILQSCVTSFKYSYEEENLPLFQGDYRIPEVEVEENELVNPSIKVVSFNIEFAQQMDKALELLQKEPLMNADVLLLQEMDEEGTELLAKKLKMNYAYYPAIYHPKYGQNVGNAILTKWDIKESQKIKLPHPSTYPAPLEGKNYIFRKTATVASIDIRGELITFVSTHSAAFNTTQKRREFADAIAAHFHDTDISCAVVGGDFNSLGSADISATVGSFLALDFLWASQFMGMTISKKKPILNAVPKAAFQLDHLFIKGMCVNDFGKVDQQGVSDHLPIWVELEVEPSNLVNTESSASY